MAGQRAVEGRLDAKSGYYPAPEGLCSEICRHQRPRRNRRNGPGGVIYAGFYAKLPFTTSQPQFSAASAPRRKFRSHIVRVKTGMSEQTTRRFDPRVIAT